MGDRVAVRPATAADLPAMARAKHEAGIAAWPHILPPEVIAELGFPDRWRDAVGRPRLRSAPRASSRRRCGPPPPTTGRDASTSVPAGVRIERFATASWAVPS